MTDKQEVGLLGKAINGDQTALASLTSAAQDGDANSEADLGSYYRAEHHYKQALAWLE